MVGTIFLIDQMATIDWRICNWTHQDVKVNWKKVLSSKYYSEYTHTQAEAPTIQFSRRECRHFNCLRFHLLLLLLQWTAHTLSNRQLFFSSFHQFQIVWNIWHGSSWPYVWIKVFSVNYYFNVQQIELRSLHLISHIAFREFVALISFTNSLTGECPPQRWPLVQVNTQVQDKKQTIIIRIL